MGTSAEHLKQYIRDIPDFPQPGVLYRDITPLLANPAAFKNVLDALATQYQDAAVEAVVAVESRGFIFGAPLAYLLGVPFVTARKFGKLPYATISVAYQLEYGEAIIEMHTDALTPGQRVLIVDDLLATGGTTAATVALVEQLGGDVIGIAFVIELTFLNGRKRLGDHDIFALIQY
ncbi:MAG: adenine phosphoribosyltransferase [Chloroflexota bacterium]|nr:adenine phosphoribosyltransferase [Chloroflexota bacterium]